MSLPFQPAVLSGGRLTEEEYKERQRLCTEEALANLQGSAEYKRWRRERQHGRSLLRSRPTLASVAAAVALLAAAAALTYGFWASSAAPQAHLDQPAGDVAAACPAAAPLNTSEELEQQLSQRAKEAEQLQERLEQQMQLQNQLRSRIAQQTQEYEHLGERMVQQAQEAKKRVKELEQRLGQQAREHKQQQGELERRAMQQASQVERAQRQAAQQAQQAQEWEQQAAGLQESLERERAQASALAKQLKAAEETLGALRAEQQELQEQNAQLVAAGQGKVVGAEGLLPLLGALPEPVLLSAAAALVLLATTTAWALHSRRAALQMLARSKIAEGTAEQVAQLQREVAAAKLKAAADMAEAVHARDAALEELASVTQQLNAAHTEARANATEAEHARQALLQHQVEMEEQLRAAKEDASQKALEAEEALGQLEEEREWRTAAQQLASLTAAALTTACVPGKASAASSPRSRSPTKRTPFAARSRNNSMHRLANSRDENSPAAAASPLRDTPLAATPPPSIAMAAAAALAAKAPDTPRAWLELLQARFAAVRDQAAATERAAQDADATLDAIRKESSWNQHKVSEMLTDNELLKERLADAKRHFQLATEAEAQAKEAAASLQARVEQLERQAGAERQEQARLRERLQAVEAEAAQAQLQLAGLQQQLEEARQQGAASAERARELGERLAAREAETAQLGEALEELERENSSLEAQADQVTTSLAHTQQQKSQLETKVAHLEQELAGLVIMAEKLEGDKAVLEQQLDKARRAHAELCAAGKQLAAAESTIRESTILSMSNNRAETPDTESDLRRAISEKVAALDMLASAEKKMLEREAADDLGLLPMNSPLRPSSRLSQLSGYDDAATPRTRGAKIVNYFSSKIDKVARLMAGDASADARSLPGTPHSRASVYSSGPAERPGLHGQRMSGTMTAWFDRLNQSFNSVGKVLHQDLSGFESPRITAELSGRGATSPVPYRMGGMERVQEALEYSAQEVVEILAALDAAEQLEGQGGSVAAAKEELQAAHMAVQVAMREVQSYSNEIALRKSAHRDLVQESQRLSGQIEFASEMVEAELMTKTQMEDRVARAQNKLSAAEAQLEGALQHKEAAEAALAAQYPSYKQDGEGAAEHVGGEVWEACLRTSDYYERCVQEKVACLDELQAALAAKREALDRVAAASMRLEQAELQQEDAAGALDETEADLNTLTSQHLRLMDVLQQQQRRQAAALQVAVQALEGCLSPDEDGRAAAAGEEEEEAAAAAASGVGGGEAALDAGQLLPAQDSASSKPTQSGATSTASKSGSQATSRTPAELAADVADLLEESWWAHPGSVSGRMTPSKAAHNGM